MDLYIIANGKRLIVVNFAVSAHNASMHRFSSCIQRSTLPSIIIIIMTGYVVKTKHLHMYIHVMEIGLRLYALYAGY